MRLPSPLLATAWENQAWGTVRKGGSQAEENWEAGGKALPLPLGVTSLGIQPLNPTTSSELLRAPPRWPPLPLTCPPLARGVLGSLCPASCCLLHPWLNHLCV